MGSINIDNTGSGADVTISSDGTDLLLDGTAIGGGGGSPDLYADNYDGTSTKPTATGTNSVSIGRLATAGGNNSFSAGNNAKAEGAYSVSVGYHSSDHSTGEGAASFGYNADAAAPYSAALGPYSVTAGSNNFPTAIGKSYASGANSFAASIGQTTSSYGATGAYGIALGQNAKATASAAVALSQATASGAGSLAFGNSCTASGTRSIALSQNASASATDSVAIGIWAKANIIGKVAFAGQGFAAASDVGDIQQGLFILRSDTTDATAEALTTNNSTPSTNNQIILPNNSAFAFHGTIVARQQASGGTASAAWKIEGLIRREGSAGTTALVNSATTVLDNTPSWGMALSADTTNGGLKIEVTGAASTNIRWVGTIHTSEVTYA